MSLRAVRDWALGRIVVVLSDDARRRLLDGVGWMGEPMVLESFVQRAGAEDAGSGAVIARPRLPNVASVPESNSASIKSGGRIERMIRA